MSKDKTCRLWDIDGTVTYIECVCVFVCVDSSGFLAQALIL